MYCREVSYLFKGLDADDYSRVAIVVGTTGHVASLQDLLATIDSLDALGRCRSRIGLAID